MPAWAWETGVGGAKAQAAQRGPAGDASPRGAWGQADSTSLEREGSRLPALLCLGGRGEGGVLAAHVAGSLPPLQQVLSWSISWRSGFCPQTRCLLEGAP